jgi:hypothetical protein
LTSPAANFLSRIRVMPFDAMIEVWHLVRAIVDGETPPGVIKIKTRCLHRQAFEANGALEAQLLRTIRKMCDPNVIAECVLNEAQSFGLRTNSQARFDNSLIVGVPRAKHHTVFAKGNRLAIAISRNVPNVQ